MVRKGFIYKLDRCIGCNACQMACKELNSLKVGEFFRRVDTFEINGHWVNYSAACNHCEDPGCVAVCPTGAMRRDEQGLVIHEDARCIGCGRCVNACPYGAVSLNSRSGYAQKCDACYKLRMKGGEPACVSACPTRALSFGDIAEAETKPQLAKGNLRFLPSEADTRPTTRVYAVCDELQRPLVLTETKAEQVQDNHFQKDTDERFVILGAGPAAISAAEAIRERNATAHIRIISGEQYYPYTRPLMSKGACKGFRHRDYIICGSPWLEKINAQLSTDSHVRALDTENKQVLLADGEIIPFDKCVYALGADCFIPTMEGSALEGVIPIRTIPNIEKLRRSSMQAEKAVVVGGGVIGLETAWQLRESGLEVSIVELGSTLMGRLCDERTALLLRECFERHGINIITGCAVESVLGEKKVTGALLSDGRKLDAQILVLSAGIKPNIAIASEAGIETGRAVIVDKHMQTSVPYVYACGDCAVFNGVNNATWIQGVQQGRVAGANAAGEMLEYENRPSSIVVHAAGTMLYTIGDLGKDVPGGDYELVCATLPPCKDYLLVNPVQKKETTHISLCFLEGRLVGAASLGALKCIRTVQQAVDAHESRDEFLEKMKAFGLEYSVEKGANNAASV